MTNAQILRLKRHAENVFFMYGLKFNVKHVTVTLTQLQSLMLTKDCATAMRTI